MGLLIQSNCKLYRNAKLLADVTGMGVLNSRERCEVYDQNAVLLSIMEYEDNTDSLRLTDGVINAISEVFKGMHSCDRIIIYSEKGQNRSPLIGARLAALISGGKNEPGELAYAYFLQLCKHVSEHFDPNLMTTWPNLCTNTWTQMAISMFNRSDGKKYHSDGGRGIHVDHPEGELTCAYVDYDSDQTVPYDIESILDSYQDNNSNSDDLSKDDESFFTANEEDEEDEER